MEHKHIEYLRYEFTPDEQVINARSMAQAAAKRQTLEQQKREVDAALKAEIESQVTFINRYSTFINNGYEYRDVECAVQFDEPHIGHKTIVRLDTGEIVKTAIMSDEDRQHVLQFPEE